MIRKFIIKEKALFFWFVVALVAIILRLFLLDIKEIMPYGAELGNILLSLSTGYIISYIFYFLVVFIKKERDNKNVSGYLIKYLSYLCIEAYRVFNGLKINSQSKSLKFPPSEDDLKTLFKKLHPVNSNCSKSNGGRYNWYEYLKFVLCETSNEYINEIWKLLPHIDTELIKILNSLKESYMFRAAWGISREIIPTDTSKINVHNDNSIPKRLAEYFEIINTLEKHLMENFKEYKEFSSERNNELYRT